MHNKILLITGGTGSFGNAVLRRFLKTDVISEIRIYSRDEKSRTTSANFTASNGSNTISDMRSSRSIGYAMEGVDFL
jgi:UDP-N-acetylglucosamine 4,6-dehydratase/5-epimerase